MSTVDYIKAYKLGEKEYKSLVGKGKYPYLPVLDDILSNEKGDTQVKLGLIQIPIEFIVGTYSAGRTTAFARNFMPILEPGSEFACKWGDLVDSMMEEGLREPIKVFEYNNRFYVMEGNKRVSVSKYMGSVFIEANVTRVIPRKSDDPMVVLYYEFLDFYELTGINYLDVRQEGNYKKLLTLTGHNPGESWSDDDKLNFKAAFTYFNQAYKTKETYKLNIGAGDAFAYYIGIFGYEDTLEKNENDFRKDLSKIWNELKLKNSGEEVTFLLNPTEESKKKAFKLLPIGGNGPLKIAFIHDKSVMSSAWTYYHELGRKYIQDVYGNAIDASCIERVDNTTADDVFEAAISAGNKVIFSTSPKHCVAAVKAAVNHPEVKILNCSMKLNHKSVRSYYLRNYEAKFILGAIAGAVDESGYIGYIADYPIRGSLAEIDAFALGVQMTNPRAKVVLDWSCIKEHDPLSRFKEININIVSARDLNANTDQNKDFGLFKVLADDSTENLAMPIRHWGKMYEEIVESIMRGGYKNDDSLVGEQALSYFWGMSAGAVDVLYSRNLSAGLIRLLRTIREGIRTMAISPFTGPIYSQNGECRCDDGQIIEPKDVVDIDWLADNVEGSIPTLDLLKEEAIELVKLQGVESYE